MSVRKFLNLNGIRFGMREWGVENSQYSKRIIALHGWLDNANSFYFLGPYLAGRGYHVVALDHCGHGHSDHVTRAGNYSMSRSVGLTREAMDALEWETSHVIGHSMGASISLMYAATFPEKIEKLVLIEGLGPLVEPPEAAARNLRRAIDSERSMRVKGTKPKLYPNLAAAIDARVNIVKTYPGEQSISREAARALVSRGSRLYNPDGTPLATEDDFEDIAREEDGPLKFRHDQRLVLPSLFYHTKEQVYSYFEHVQSQTLFIQAEHGWPMMSDDLAMRKSILESKGLLQQVHVEGSHHPHMDPHSAPIVASHVEQFLAKSRVPRREL